MNLRSALKFWFFKDTTHNGEFRAMRQLAGADCPRVFVDVGANDGFYGSNSFPFVARGWRSLLIEPHPGAFAKLRKLHAGRKNVTMLNLACSDKPGTLPLWIGVDGDAGTLATLCTDDHPHFRQARTDKNVLVPVHRLENILAGQNIPHEFGILSIDTEGMDYEVLLGLDLDKWKPRVIVTEDFEPKGPRKNEYLQSSGYIFRRQIGPNSFWTRAAK